MILLTVLMHAGTNFYVLILPFKICKIFSIFFKVVSYAHQGCNYLTENTVKTVKYYNNLKDKFSNLNML